MARERNPRILPLVLAMALALSGSSLAETVKIVPPSELTDDAIPGQQMNPASIVYDGLLYAFWASNSAETPIGSDFDITYATCDGSEWSQNIVLTSNDTGNDHTPRPVVFRDSLYLFWSSTNPAITGGSDADIVFSTLSGGAWSAPVSITSDFDSTGDYDPCPVAFGSGLEVFFESFDAASAHYEIAHASLSSAWGEPEYITENSTGHNLNPTAAAVGQALVLAWESTSEALAGQAGKAIVSTVFSSSGRFSDFVAVSGTAGPMNIDPFIAAYLGEAWLFWSTNSEDISRGSDFDIVARTYGAGGWSDTVTEIAAIPDTGNDTGPAALVYDDKLVLTWVSDSYGLDGETEADTDIMLAVSGGTGWSAPVSVSYDDGDRDDGGGATHRTVSMSGYDGRLLMVWETNASPLLTETRDTWLVLAEFGFASSGTGLYWIVVPAALAAAAAAFILIKRR